MHKLIFLLMCAVLKHVCGHLKDMGEVTINWTAVLSQLENRIVGGVPTNLERFPFNVQFYNYGGMCSGSILTSMTVLTAAHCFDHNRNIAEMTVLSNSRFTFDIRANSHEVWDFKLHENYNESSVFANDIAIILIHDQFKFDSTVKKAVLCDNDKWMNENEVFEAVGWGQTVYKGETSKSGLMRTYLRFVSKKNCMIYNKAVLSSDMFCLWGDGIRDTCKGDSGGGILWKNVTVGIVSHGSGCAVVPAMYTNVFYFRNWIKRTINELYKRYCLFHVNSPHVT